MAYYLRTYENILTIGDFNLSVDNSYLEDFKQEYDLGSLIKKPPCYQSSTPSCIDLILSDRAYLSYLILLKLVCQTIINLFALF